MSTLQLDKEAIAISRPYEGAEVRAYMSGQIINRVDLPDEAGSIVLYDWMSDVVKEGRNLMRVDAHDSILLRATSPTTGIRDCFAQMRLDGKALTANTWSCYGVGVDVQDAGVAVLEFTPS